MPLASRVTKMAATIEKGAAVSRGETAHGKFCYANQWSPKKACFYW